MAEVGQESLRRKLRQNIKIVGGCWILQKAIFKSTGYGHVWWNGAHHTAHRLAYQAFSGENAKQRKDGGRDCATCQRQRNLAYYRKDAAG